MVAINPKRLMVFSLVAILLKAIGASGGSLPASLPESHSSSAAAERSTPRRGASPLSAQANLGLDLGKLGRRVTEGSVYDMFPGASKPESALSGQDQTGTKKQRAARRPSNSKTPPPPPISPVAVPVAPIEPVVVEPPPPPPPPPPPIPTPPFPFKYVGSNRPMSGQITYFLTKGNQLYTVEVGQILDTVYSIDGEEGDQLTVTYLPLDRTQTISTGLPQ